VSRLTATERFDRTRHRVDSFNCGHDALDRWLRAHAGQAQRRDAARTFVTAETDGTVAGYYTLVAAQVRHEAATTSVSRGISRHFPIPVALLARLAVDQRRQGTGVGRSLLLDALRRVIRASDELAVRAITVDAIDAPAEAFYRHFGFEPSPLSPGTLMVALESVRRVIGPSN
jgi:GNAT superfamily N-acetyltransferase